MMYLKSGFTNSKPIIKIRTDRIAALLERLLSSIYIEKKDIGVGLFGFKHAAR
jgi:hypothetical protein